MNDATGNSPISFVELSELRTAVESAASDVSLDLDEAVALKDLMEKVEKWFDRVTIAAPKRSKRQGRTMRPKYTVDDLVALIEEASSLPVNTEEEVKRLQMQLSNIQTWRLQASHELEKIGFGFDQLRENVKLAYGLPNEFCLDSKFNEVSDDDESLSDNDENNEHDEKMDVEKSTESNKDLEDNCSQSDSASTAGSNGDGALTHSGKGDSNVHRMIREVQNGAKGNGVLTAEAEMADVLESVSSWCVRSMKYLSSPREIFDKRFFGAFDRFIKEGQDLHEKSKTSASDSDDDKFFKILGSSWGGLVSDQLDRLAILRSERGKFTEWCDLASQILSDEKKMTVEKLKEIADQSRSFPSGK